MFDVYCARHGSRVLLTESAIFGLADTESGPSWPGSAAVDRSVCSAGCADDGTTVTEVQPLVAAA
ncbi:MAG: hypothetical protein R2705_13255 [Ilumatobacteraceae bacterium]